MNRESWLTAAAEELWPLLVAAGGTRPDSARYSCSWPSTGALRRHSSNSRTLGQAWHAGSADGTREVQISPVLADALEVLDVLGHEMVHQAVPGGSGHGPVFQRVCKRFGYEAKAWRGGKSWRVAGASEQFMNEVLRPLAKKLGKYPHARLDADLKPKRPGSPLKAVSCPDCGYNARITRVWIDKGLPTCPCGAIMESLEYEAEGEPLTIAESHVVYHTADRRFTLTTTAEGRRESTWIVRENFRPLLDEDGKVLATSVVDPETGDVTTIEATEPSHRWAYRKNRTDALGFVMAVRDGVADFPEVELEEQDDEVDEDELGPLGWDDIDPDEHLDDDEDEEYDNPDDALTDEELEEYERVSALRDASGSKKSLQIIAAGGEGAMD